MRNNWILTTFLIAGLGFSVPGVLHCQVISKTYRIPNPSLKKNDHYQQVIFSNTIQTGLPGEPSLPYFPVSLLLPPGQEAVSIEFLGEDLKEIPGTFDLPPVQYSKPLSKDQPGEWIKNQMVYSGKKAYPADASGKLTTQYLHGHGFAFVTFTPVRYFPKQKKLFYYQSVTIRVKTRTAEKASGIVNARITLPAFRQVQSLAQNPELLDLYPPVTSDTSDYQALIIMPEVFTGHFQDWVDFYFVRGMKTKIVTTSAIYSNTTGADNQEKIRNFIIQEYQDHQVRHVLLAGDIEHVPARGFYCQVQSSSLYVDYDIPADLYYSALDGNWNTDGDNMWAEIGEDDLLPEVSVGRLPVSTVAELDNLIYKSLHYQDHPIAEECRKPLMVGEKLYDNPLTWGGDYMDLLIGLHSDNGYTTQGIPESQNIQKLYDRDLPSPWNSTQLLALINSGAAFLHHAGHSNQSYLMRMTNSAITDANFSLVNGILHNFIPIYTHGCYCAAFDYSDCIAEKMLNLSKFAVAFFGNSRYGWFNEGTTEGPSEHLQREFVNALFAPVTGQAGNAHRISKINTAPWVNAPGQWEEGALRWCFYDCNLLGDPALFLWTDSPLDLSLIFDDTITTGTALLPVHADTNGISVAGVICTILKDSVMLGTALTDSLGNALVPLGELPLDTGFVTLVISGYNCLNDTAFIRVLPQSSLSGLVYYPNNIQTPLDSVLVSLVHQGSTVNQTYTDPTGHYSFQDLTPGSYQVTVTAARPPGGINSTDALLTLRHFVQLISLSGIFLKAADVDQNQVVNSIDALYIQRYFVGLIANFPAGAWTFESPIVNLSGSGQYLQDIKGLSTGDVNGSFHP